MKKNLFSVAIISAMMALTSCGGLGTTGTTTTQTNTNQSGDLLGGMLGAALGGTGTAASGLDAGSLIGSVLGGLLGNGTNANTIVGTWVYSQPAIQFESENFLAQAGGSVASTAIVNKIEPYYQQIGITPGAFAITFNKDNTCQYTLKGQTYNGTYTFNSSNGTISIKGQILTFPSAYITVQGSQMCLTFDSTKLLTIAQGIASASQNSTLSTLGSLSTSFKGMKTGFLFQKR